MSHVTNVIICASVLEKQDEGAAIVPPIAAINARLNEHGAFADIGDHAGGYKHMECEVYGAAFNHLSLRSLIEAIRSARWEAPEDVQILIQDQEETRFTLYGLADIKHEQVPTFPGAGAKVSVVEPGQRELGVLINGDRYTVQLTPHMWGDRVVYAGYLEQNDTWYYTDD